MKVILDRGAGIGLIPDSIDLAELADPFHAWESAEAALEANGLGAALEVNSDGVDALDAALDALDEQFTTWMDADAAEALGRCLVAKAEHLRYLTQRGAA